MEISLDTLPSSDVTTTFKTLEGTCIPLRCGTELLATDNGQLQLIVCVVGTRHIVYNTTKVQMNLKDITFILAKIATDDLSKSVITSISDSYSKELLAEYPGTNYASSKADMFANSSFILNIKCC